jgi:hypothetical protein
MHISRVFCGLFENVSETIQSGIYFTGTLLKIIKLSTTHKTFVTSKSTPKTTDQKCI